jgi:hypothetical protein
VRVDDERDSRFVYAHYMGRGFLFMGLVG